MTKKKFPCSECGAIGYEPHDSRCAVGKARSKAARKNQASRKQVPVTVAVTGGTSEPEQSVLVNRVAIVFDRSGSMGLIHDAAIDALNSQLDAIKVEASKTGQPTYVSVYDFGSDVRCLFRNQYIHSISRIGRRDIRISGMTAMMDAVGTAISDLESLPDAREPNVSFLVMTITDGMENASMRFGQSRFIREIQRLNGTDRWTFVFSGPSSSRSYLTRLGVHPGNIQEWDQTEQGVSDMAFNVNVGVQSYYATRSAGQTSTKQFFTVDMSKVDDSDIKNMTDQSSNFKILKVDNSAPGGKEWVIREFVEDRLSRNTTLRRQVGSSYGVGLAYYQLTKPENVQPGKDLVVRDKSTGAVYGGHEARAIIGMPTGVNVRVKPGNFGNYDIFIKSTSVNRKLVRGTDLLYRIR